MHYLPRNSQLLIIFIVLLVLVSVFARATDASRETKSATAPVRPAAGPNETQESLDLISNPAERILQQAQLSSRTGRTSANGTTCGTPQFFAPRDYSLNDEDGVRLFSTDLNNDGRADLFSTLQSTFAGGYRWMSIGTHGGFAAPAAIDLSDAQLLEFADFDHDGKIDVVVPGTSQVWIYRGVGDGTLQLMVTLPIIGNGFLKGTAVGDYNGDGLLDLATTNNSVQPSKVYIYLGTGSFTFGPPATINFPSVEVRDINTADLNHDGKLDLVVSRPDFSVVWVMLGNGNGTFGPTSVVQMYGRDLQIIDFNGDGHLDLTAVDNITSIALGNGTGTFATPIVFVDDPLVRDGVFSDLTGDGKLDLVVSIISGNHFQPGRIKIFAGDGLGNFSLISNFLTQPEPASILPLDLNLDGQLDLVTINYGFPSTLRVNLNSCGDTSPRIRIFGSVQDEFGFPIPGSFITLTSAESGPLSYYVNETGDFEFPNLVPNIDYTVTIFRSGYTFTPTSYTLNHPVADQYVGFSGVPLRYRLGGLLSDGEGGASGLAQIPIHLTGEYGIDRWTTTDAEGFFYFDDVPQTEGFYFLTPTETPTAFFPVPTVQVHPFLSDRFVTLGGRRNRYDITVKATRPNGTPCPFVIVLRDGTTDYRMTDYSGIVTYGNIGAGRDYTISAHDPAYRVTPKANPVPFLSSSQTVNLRATLRPLADFDGDGKTDVSVFRPGNGTWYVRPSSSGALQAQAFGAAEDLPAPADYDGDEKTDIAVFRPSNGTWYMLLSTTGEFRAIAFGTNGDIPAPADFDREGRADITVFRPSTGTWYILPSYDPNYRVFNWGTSGDQPFTGDFDGDTYPDLAVFRPSTGSWYILPFSGPAQSLQFGAPGDLALTGDFDGDNRHDLGVFRPSDGNWYIRQSTDGALRAAHFGVAGDIPMAGDFDGDGKSDLTVFRPSVSMWYTQQSSNAAVTATYWGSSSDRPVPAAYTH